mmetsp:Transcript_93282/g.241120  ORF Transcript_93282/g.241120 Transcript_93282/m.241120 type:complete len:287 (-) Transcript_93282:391-1251(-)
MWTSKLGNKYSKELIDKLDTEYHHRLQLLRRCPHNAHCFDCGEGETSHASVNIGVFLCERCADIHRAMGTHISKVKGCMGTYLWGPDEVARMEQVGNRVAEAQYGDVKPDKCATREERLARCQRKYHKVVAVPTPPTSPAGVTSGSPKTLVAGMPGSPKPLLQSGRLAGGIESMPEPAPGPGMLLGRRRHSRPQSDLDFDTVFKETIGAPALSSKKDSPNAGARPGNTMIPNFAPMPFRQLKTGTAGKGPLETPSGVVPISPPKKPANVNLSPEASDPMWDDFGNW